MRFYDIDSDIELSLFDLYREYKTFVIEDPYNHAKSFTYELLNIIMDTINGRNNMDIIGMTGKEISNYIIRLKNKVL